MSALSWCLAPFTSGSLGVIEPHNPNTALVRRWTTLFQRGLKRGGPFRRSHAKPVFSEPASSGTTMVGPQGTNSSSGIG